MMSVNINWLDIVLGYLAISVVYGYWWSYNTNKRLIQTKFKEFLFFLSLSWLVGWIQIPIDFLQWIWVKFIKVEN